MSSCRVVGALAAVLGAVGAVGAIGAVGAWRSTKRDANLVALSAPTLHLGKIPVGRSEATFVIHNDSERPIRIVGAQEYCNRSCCCKPATSELPTIAPGESIRYRCGLNVSGDGPFTAQLSVLYFNDGYQRVELKAGGEAVKTAEGRHETANK